MQRNLTDLTVMSDPSSGERLKLKMSEKGVTVSDLAASTGLSTRTITALRSGRSRGNFTTWRLISRRLGCSVEEVIGG